MLASAGGVLRWGDRTFEETPLPRLLQLEALLGPLAHQAQAAVEAGLVDVEQQKAVRRVDPVSSRGGSHLSDRSGVRCAYRDRNEAWGWVIGDGFRCVRDIES